MSNKECPKCQSYMHRCQAPDAKGNGGCGGQTVPLRLKGGHQPPSSHPAGNWWICVFCDVVEPA